MLYFKLYECIPVDEDIPNLPSESDMDECEACNLFSLAERGRASARVETELVEGLLSREEIWRVIFSDWGRC